MNADHASRFTGYTLAVEPTMCICLSIKRIERLCLFIIGLISNVITTFACKISYEPNVVDHGCAATVAARTDVQSLDLIRPLSGVVADTAEFAIGNHPRCKPIRVCLTTHFGSLPSRSSGLHRRRRK